jgi:hypothetical protein
MTLSVAAVGATLAVPAAAQFSSGRSTFEERPRPEPVQLHDFFQFPFFGDHERGPANPFNPSYPPRQPQAFESVKPPPPRKVETPPASTILVIGDSLADWLGYGLEQAFTDTPEIGIVRKIRPYSGLVRYDFHPDSPEWSQALKDVLAAEKPSAIVVMLGVNDRLPLRDRVPAKSAAPSPQGQAAPPAGPTPAGTAGPDSEQPAAAAPEPQRRGPSANYEFHTDKWAELYGKRIDDMIAVLKGKGVPVVWVGLPAIRGTRSTSDMSYLDELYRAHAEKAGITYVDIWDGFVDEKGNFAVQGPDFEGQIRRLRTFDGINFTKAGAEKLAHFVEHELLRVMTNRVVPVALPGPEEQSKGSAVGARPAVGPVMPLSATASGEGGDLLGATSHPAPATSDPVATRVLSRGDAIAAPPGRADDFSWPRAGADANGATDTAPVVSVPPQPSPKGSSKGETNKNDTGKNEQRKPNEARAQAAPNAASTRLSRPRPTLYGAPPRPPLPVGPGRD